MIVTCVHVHVKQDHVDDFIAVSTANHNESVKEPGNMRFDVLQSADDPAAFLLYEAYDSLESAAAHKETPHYKEWRTSVADLMASPREGIKYNAIAP